LCLSNHNAERKNTNEIKRKHELKYLFKTFDINDVKNYYKHNYYRIITCVFSRQW